MKYSYGAYNKWDEKEQWIRLTEGCPNDCPYCYEPKEYKIFDIPEIVRNRVKIMDMNLLCKEEAFEIIEMLGSKKVDGRCVRYELVCGIDHRFLTESLSRCLYRAHFKNIRMAWDYYYADQFKIKAAINMLIKAGYKNKGIMIFMVCNWKITQKECLQKLNLCKYWNVRVADCYYDNQTMPNVKPIHWTIEEIKEFRRSVRKHNQFVGFRCDPEMKKNVLF